MENHATSLAPASPVDAPAAVPAAPPEKGLKAWVLRSLNSPYATAVMAGVAVIDASFFPIPPFAMLGPMVLTRPRRAAMYALVGTIASLLGGLAGYAMGYFASEWVKSNLGIDLDVRITRFGIDKTIAEILRDSWWMLALLASVLPTPFKVVAIGSGLLRVEFWVFMLAAVIGRTSRMFGFCLTLAFAREWAVKRFKVKLPPGMT
ncbi:MAG: VTT domain-containing protein [Myxococcota bacterium]